MRAAAILFVAALPALADAGAAQPSGNAREPFCIYDGIRAGQDARPLDATRGGQRGSRGSKRERGTGGADAGRQAPLSASARANTASNIAASSRPVFWL
jgi:hypothetical protein